MVGEALPSWSCGCLCLLGSRVAFLIGPLGLLLLSRVGFGLPSLSRTVSPFLRVGLMALVLGRQHSFSGLTHAKREGEQEKWKNNFNNTPQTRARLGKFSLLCLGVVRPSLFDLELALHHSDPVRKKKNTGNSNTSNKEEHDKSSTTYWKGKGKPQHHPEPHATGEGVSLSTFLDRSN